eukprot:scaffold49448_cov15-Tisochrysis_lutea.AAC.1
MSETASALLPQIKPCLCSSLQHTAYVCYKHAHFTPGKPRGPAGFPVEPVCFDAGTPEGGGLKQPAHNTAIQ